MRIANYPSRFNIQINLYKQPVQIAKLSGQKNINSNNKELINLNARDVAGILYTNSFAGITASTVTSSFLAFTFNNPLTRELSLVWWLVMTSILLIRMGDALFWRFSLVDLAFNGKYAQIRFSIGCILTAIFWSIYPLVLFEELNGIQFTVTIVIISSLAVGSSTALAANSRLSISYSLILLLPISVYTLFSSNEERQLLGVLLILLSIVIIVYSLRSGKFTFDAIKLKNSNTQLVAQMENEQTKFAKVSQELKEVSEKLNHANSGLEAEVKKRTDRIFQLSNLDPLTGLMNRKAFTKELSQLIDRATHTGNHLALLFIDLDGFKKINDSMGHHIGDNVLIEVTSRIKAFTDENTSGRWGGDEFLVALPYSDVESATSIASAIIASISQPIHVNSNEVHLSAAVGIAMCPEHDDTAAELIQLADLAMCEQKHTGANHPKVFSKDLKQKIDASRLFLDGLQNAIEKKQLYVCYQPIQCAKDNYSWSFEALLRWDFDGKLVGPDVFIPLAEKSGLIKEIGAWVLNRACMDASYWQHCQQAAVSVNVSIIQLMDDGFIRVLDNALRSSGLPAERLHIEVTESVFVDNAKKIREQLDAIQKRNIHVSIDDFGTGYSSLSQLQTLPVNYVKIDKSFVDNMETNGDAVIRATLFLARELNCKTVAEGVETKEQAMALSAMGVDFLQGYYFAKPMRNDDLIIWQNPITSVISSPF
jgi:diguanylate cyclase (GGDEF)-like protein